MVSRALSLTLRGLEFAFTLLIMALVGNMIANAFKGNPSIVNYDMFVSVFGMLTLIYLILVTVKDDFVIIPILPIALDALNTLFFLIGGIATAAELGVHSCTNDAYLASNKITNGVINHRTRRCREAQASTAFLWFGFAAFAASTFFSFLASRGSVNVRGIRRGGPSMSQV